MPLSVDLETSVQDYMVVPGVDDGSPPIFVVFFLYLLSW